MTRWSALECEDGIDEAEWERLMDELPPPARVPDVGRTVAAALAWRLDRTAPAMLRAETTEAATVRPGGAR